MTSMFGQIFAMEAELRKIHRVFESKHDAYPTYTELIANSISLVKIVTDTGDPVLFEHSPLMKRALEDAINKYSVNIQFVFHINDYDSVFHQDKDYNKAIKEFSETNPNLWALSRNPFQKLYLQLYWIPKRPEQHYSIIDKEWVYYEHPHEKGQDTIVEIYHNISFAKELSSIFDKLVIKCRKVE